MTQFEHLFCARNPIVSKRHFSVPAEREVSPERLKTVQFSELISSIFASVGKCNLRINPITYFSQCWVPFK
jgi:hypothetical protein